MAHGSDENSPLLPKPDNEDFANESHDGLRGWALSIASEFWILFKGSLPVIMAYALQNSLQTFSVLIVGRLSPEALSVAAFCYMWAMATAWLIGMGGTTAIDTLCSASFTGSKNKHDLGIILQRAFVVLTIFYIPVIVLWMFSGPIFRALGQEEYIARDGSKFLMVLLPGGLGYIYFECMKKYLQAQGIMRAGTWVLLITSPINAGLNYLFVYTLAMGLLGAPFATSVSYWLSFLLLLAYTYFVDGYECWGGFDRAAFHNLFTFVRIATFGVIHVGTEWWAFEIVAIVAGQLGSVPLASQSVIMTADQVMYTIPFGQGVATSARVGNLLGAKDARGAARAANSAAVLSMLIGAIVLIILMATKENFARLFNNDEQVVRLTAEVLPYVGTFSTFSPLRSMQTDTDYFVSSLPNRRRPQWFVWWIIARYGPPAHWRCSQRPRLLRLCPASWSVLGLPRMGTCGFVVRSMSSALPGWNTGMGDCCI